MISCPSCGTANRKGSSYCSHCGQRLDAFGTTQCPVCSAPNPAGNPSCAFCGTPLAQAVESDRTPPPSVPSSQPEPTEATPTGPELTADSRAELPPWLYQRPKAAGSETDREPSKYLQGLRGVLKDEEGWLASSLGKYLAERGNKP